MHVVIYFKGGRQVATCPPDEEPNNGSFDTWYSGEGTTHEEAVKDALAACDWEAGEATESRLTVGELREQLARFPDGAFVLAYEGEVTGLLVGKAGFIPTPYRRRTAGTALR